MPWRDYIVRDTCRRCHVRVQKIIVPVHDLAMLRPIKCRHSYLSIQLNQMHFREKLNVHIDKNNTGLNSVISLGNYTGGRLWVEGLGDDPPPTHCVQSPDNSDLKGAYLNTHHKWVTFSPTRRHCIEPIRDGVRYSIVLFTPGRVSSLTPAHKAELTDLGFPGIDEQTSHQQSIRTGHYLLE